MNENSLTINQFVSLKTNILSLELVRQSPRGVSRVMIILTFIYIYALILTGNQLYYMCAENQFIRPPN